MQFGPGVLWETFPNGSHAGIFQNDARFLDFCLMWENRHLFDCPIKSSLELCIGSRIDLMFHKPEAKNTKLMLAKQNIEG